MVGRDDQFVEVHRSILRLLAQDVDIVGRSHLELSPSCIARNIGYRDNDYVGRGCRELAQYGLLDRAEDGPYYSISEKGLAYVGGEINVEDIRVTDP